MHLSFSINRHAERSINLPFQTSTTVYSDPYRGMLTQSVLVDITGDNQTDIITAMFNSTVVAINGKSLEQLWNFTVPNAVSLFVPTPAYFNGDNVTDFLIMYKKGQDISDVGLVEVGMHIVVSGKFGCYCSYFVSFM